MNSKFSILNSVASCGIEISHSTIPLYSPGLTGLLVGGVDVGEGPRELFIACDDISAALLTTGGFPLY